MAEADGHKEKELELKEALAAQPESLASGILLPDVTDFNYGYVPGSTEGHDLQLNLPSNIELPGIAQDMTYGFEGGSHVGSIVPSAFKNDNLLLPDLPQIEWVPGSNTPVPDATPNAMPSASNPTGPAAPPPPPPPPPPPSGMPPPPAVATNEVSSPAAPPPPGPPRGGLLDSIQGFNKTKLKPKVDNDSDDEVTADVILLS